MATSPPILADERQRLAALRDLYVLDSQPEPVFDQIVGMASQICGTPMALLSLVDEERQWFKAKVGLHGVSETPRSIAFCAHAIAGDAVFEVPDAALDARFADNPLVQDDPALRFYAGAPLVLAGGERVGTLCVLDRVAGRLTAAQLAMLRSLAAIASEALTLRRELLGKAMAVRTRYERMLADSEARYRTIVEAQTELVSLARPDGELVYVNPAYAQHFGLTPAAMVGTSLFDHVQPADRDAVRRQLDGVLQAGHSASGENRMIAADGTQRWVAWTNGRQTDTDGSWLLHSVGRDVTARRQAEQALRASQAFLLRTGQVAGVGGWALELGSGSITWSEQIRRIHEVDDDYQPTLTAAIEFYPPEARGLIEAAVQTGMERGEPWDLELPFVTARGRPIWVRTVGEVEFEQGRPVRLVGAFQDVTERKRLEQRIADDERFLRQITDSLPVRIAYTDRELRYRFANLAHCRRFGLERDAIIGRTRSELAAGHLDPAVALRLDAALAGELQQFEFDEVVDGDLRRIETQLIPDIDDRGAVRGFYSTGIDITERTAAKQLLQRQAATLSSVTEALPATIAIVDTDIRYRFVNAAFVHWCGQPRERIVGHPVAEVLGEIEFERRRPWIEKALAGEAVSFEQDNSGRDGPSFLSISYIPLRLADGALDGFVVLSQDITRQKREEARLQLLSQRDPLTGLLNRAGFERQLQDLMNDGQGGSMALLYIDLDRFKPVNDRHGHAVGDQVLQLFAKRLQRVVRPTDAVARIGGDEFAIMLPGVRERAHAHMVADKVIAAATAPFEVAEHFLRVGASVGVAFGADPVTGWGDLLERADAQLYRAKAAGRGRRAGEPD